MEVKITKKLDENDKNIQKIWEINDDTLDDIKDINRRMLIKADKDQFQKIQMDLKRFALYDDFKDLYNKTMKPMQKFQDQMHEYSQEHREVKAAVRSLDESLMGKANKTDFFDVRN